MDYVRTLYNLFVNLVAVYMSYALL